MHSNVLACAAIACLAAAADAQVPQGPTRTVDVLGTKTRVMTLGVDTRVDGEPVLLLFTGAGAGLDAWGPFVTSISELAPVVAYDRPGLGQSEFDAVPPTPQHVTTFAHALLSVLGIRPPYVLVGHSWGGPLILYYAGRFPDEVAGLVYLEPTDARQTLFEYYQARNEAEYQVRQAEFAAAVEALDASPGVKAEMQAIVQFRRTRLEDRGLPEEPNVPTAIFLSANVDVPPGASWTPSFMNQEYRKAGIRLNVATFAARVLGRPNTTLIVATDAGHSVHRSDPVLATEAVRRVLDAVRKRSIAPKR